METFYDFGRKGASGLVDEEDLTDEFNFYKISAKISHKFDPLTSFSAKYQFYQKDYDTLENTDNNFNTISLDFDKTFKTAYDFLVKIGPDFEFKRKIYEDRKDFDYDQIKFDLPFTLKREGDFTIRVAGGINSYHYPDAPKDELKLNTRLDVSKKFLDERLTVSAFYKYQHIYRQKIADRNEITYGGDFAVSTKELPFLKGFAGGVEEGKDNTKTIEEREDAFDFKFWNWWTKGKFSIYDKVKTDIKYTYLTRQYADFDHNYNGFMLENDWRLRAMEQGDLTLDMKFLYFHKQFRFPYVSSPFAYHLNAVAPEMELKKKDDWNISLLGDIKFYDYPARSVNDKIYYTAKAMIEKYLFKKSLIVGLDYRYTFKNFLHRIDITENALRIRATARF